MLIEEKRREIFSVCAGWLDARSVPSRRIA